MKKKRLFHLNISLFTALCCVVGLCSTAIAAVSLSPFWHTYWAYMLCALLLCFLFYICLHRIWSLKRRNTELQDLIDSRTKELASKVIQLKKSERKAHQLAQSKSQFLANMSHEIRTPMNGVMGMVGMLLATAGLTHEQREYAEIVKRSGDALLKLIDDILDFSKIEAGKLRLECVDFDITTIVEDTLELLARKAHMKGIAILSSIATEVPQMVQGDPVRVKQIFTNLLDNAIKFTEEGEILVSVKLVSDARECVTLRCEIRDTGIGISKETLSKLFEPFTQANASTARTHGGTGLGLAISKQLAEMMNGNIGAESKQGKGSTFWFTLGLGKSSVKVNEPLGLEELQGRRVLSVVTNQMLAATLKRQFVSWNVISESVSNAEAALDLLLDGPRFDVAIIDSQLVDADWLTLVRKIRSAQSLSKLPVIVMFPFGESFVKTESVTFLPKPIRRSQLITRLYSAIFNADENGIKDWLGDATASFQIVDFNGTTERKSNTAKALNRNGSAKILVVEDNFVNRKVIAGVLENMGFHVKTATNGKGGVETWRAEQPFDLILMDCQMPHMDGFETTKQIRLEEGKGSHTPIIALTAGELSNERAKCFEVGMDDFASKPIQLDELELTIGRWLKGPNQQKQINKNGSAKCCVKCDSNGHSNVLDKKALDQLLYLQSADRPDWLNELAKGFFAGTRRRLAQLQETIEQGDSKAVSFLAHTLKGACFSFGALHLSELCDRLGRKSGNEISLTEKKELLGQIENEFARVRKAIEMFQSELNVK